MIKIGQSVRSHIGLLVLHARLHLRYNPLAFFRAFWNQDDDNYQRVPVYLLCFIVVMIKIAIISQFLNATAIGFAIIAGIPLLFCLGDLIDGFKYALER